LFVCVDAAGLQRQVVEGPSLVKGKAKACRLCRPIAHAALSDNMMIPHVLGICQSIVPEMQLVEVVGRWLSLPLE
jgi:hypothetical protein